VAQVVHKAEGEPCIKIIRILDQRFLQDILRHAVVTNLQEQPGKKYISTKTTTQKLCTNTGPSFCLVEQQPMLRILLSRRECRDGSKPAMLLSTTQ